MTIESQNLSIDWQHLNQISGGDAAFELELLQLFEQDTQVHLATLRAAIAAQNAAQVVQSAHHIKGASANVGLTILSQTAAILEQQARLNQLHRSQELLAKLEQLLQGLQAYLKDWPDGGSALKEF